MANLQADANNGLSSAEAQKRLAQYGPNALEAKEETFMHKLIHAFMGPIEYMIEAAAVISAIIGHWDDFIIILVLLIFNVTIDLWQSQKASSALAALKKRDGSASQCLTGWKVSND